MKHHTERRADCPFCDPPDTKGHLYQNGITKAWICFKCGRTGKGLLNVSWYGRTTIIDVEHELPHAQLDDDWYEPLDLAVHHRAAAYLSSHHVRVAVAKQYRVGVSRRTKLVLPVFHPAREDRLLFYQTRHLTRKLFRSYGQRAAVVPLYDFTPAPTGRVAIVESIVSALRLAPFTPTVAVCGKLVSQWQQETLRRLCWKKRVFVWLDSDARQQQIQLTTQLREWALRVIPIITADHEDKGLDPCDLTDGAVQRLLSRGDAI